MARSTPSLLALLGIAAVAGYQNRDKLGQMLGQTGSSAGSGAGGGLSDLLSSLGGGGQGRGFGDLAPQGGFGAGLRDLMESFSSGGRREIADSWVSRGPNRSATESDLEASLGPDVIEELSARTGLDRTELLRRLSQSLPDTVDSLTPEGRLPD